MLEVTRQDGVARVTLNRPELRNAFDDALIGKLSQAFAELAVDRSVRVIVLAGNGPAFCAGADLNWMKRMAGYSYEENLADAKGLADMLAALDRLPKPTIARVHGPVFAGGTGLVAACDIAVGTPEAKFCLSEAKLGLSPATISPYVIRAMGERLARRYFLTAEVFDAQEAYRIGMLSLLVPAGELDAAVAELVKHLLAGGRSRTRRSRRSSAMSPADGPTTRSRPRRQSASPRSAARPKAAKASPPSSKSAKLPGVRQDPDRQSRRDRVPRRAHGSPAWHRDGRGLHRCRSRRAPRAKRRRGAPHRDLSRYRRRHCGCPCHADAGDPPRLRLPLGKRRVRRRAARRASCSSARRRKRSPQWATRQRRSSSWREPACRSFRAITAKRRTRRSSKRKRSASAFRAHQALGRRRRQRHARGARPAIVRRGSGGIEARSEISFRR